MILLRNEGTFDNTDIAGYAAKILKVDLNKTTRELFVPLKELYPSPEYRVTVDTSLAAEGAGSVTVGKGKMAVIIPFNRDYAVCGSDTLALGGRALYSKMGNAVYLPRAAGNLFSGKKK